MGNFCWTKTNYLFENMRVISAEFFALAASVSAKCYGNYNAASLTATDTKKGKTKSAKKGSLALKKKKEYMLSLTGADCENVATKLVFQYQSKSAVDCSFTAEDNVDRTVSFGKSESSASGKFPGGFKSLKLTCDGSVKFSNIAVVDPSVTEPCAVSKDLTGSQLKNAGDTEVFEFAKCGQSGTYDVTFSIQAKKSGSFTLSTGSSEASKPLPFEKKTKSVSSTIMLSSANKTTTTLTLVDGKLKFLRFITGTAQGGHTDMPTDMPTGMPSSMTAQPAAVAAPQEPVAAPAVPKSGKCTDIPDCKNIADSTSDKKKICCGEGAKAIYSCCQGKGFTLSPTTFNTTSPTIMTTSPTGAPTVCAKRLCIQNTQCQVQSLALFSDTALNCYFDATNLALFPEGSKFNSSGRCTVAVHKNKLCCPDNANQQHSCCDSFTHSPTHSPTPVGPTTGTDSPSTASPTKTYASTQCGYHKACVDLGNVNLANFCCPYSADGLTEASINTLMARVAPNEVLSNKCCPCNTNAGNRYGHVCKSKLS